MNPAELPLFASLETVTTPVKQTTELNPRAPLEKAINSIFLDQSEENKIIKTRKHLGEIGKAFSDEQVECIITNFQFLIDTWMDEYEKDVFNEMTLREVINKG
ncbi:MAG TPA: hypothetical protein VMR41_06515 [Patescibacteria group bacterium]|nr:hypothetical protein [Patescibacteria group bacterium]